MEEKKQEDARFFHLASLLKEKKNLPLTHCQISEDQQSHLGMDLGEKSGRLSLARILKNLLMHLFSRSKIAKELL